MPWPKTPTAEEILGMSAEELKTKLGGAASKEDLTAALKPFEAQASSIEEIKKSLAALTTSRETPPPVVDDTDPAVSMLSNPKGFVADETKGLRQSQLETQAALSEIQARQNPEFAGIFRQYGTEIDGLVAKVPLATRATPNFWQSCMRQFIGDKFVRGEIRQNNFPSLLGSSSVVRGADGNADDPNFGFSQDMIDFFKGRGKNQKQIKDLAFIRDRMQRDGETISSEAWQNRPH